MKYNLINRDEELSAKQQILKNRGIENYEEYLNVSVKNIIHWSKLKNIDEAYLKLKSIIDSNGKISCLMDVDGDGIFSSAMIYNYFKNYNLVMYLNEGKDHGLDTEIFPKILDDAKNKIINILIVPDAQVDDKKCKLLLDEGVSVICLDHHDSFENKNAILINPKFNEGYQNMASSGSLVTWKFLQCFDEKEGTNVSDRFIDLVCFSILSDSMSLHTLENRAILNEGFSKITNKALVAFIRGIEKPEKEENSFSKKIETPTDASFNLIPLLNAVIRSGSSEEKRLVLDAFAEIDTYYDYINPKTKEEKKESVYEKAFRICKNSKARQDKDVAKQIEIVRTDISENDRNRHKILFCKASDDVSKNFSGLIAIKLATEFNKPVVLLREGKNGYLSGSIRNFDGSPLTDLKGFLESFGQFQWVMGHKSAAGCAIFENKLKKLIPMTDEKLKDYSFEKSYEIDFQFELSDLLFQDEFLQELYDMRYFYGQGITKSYTLLKNLTFNSSNIMFMGKEGKKDTWKINLSSGIDLIKFKNDIKDPFYEMFGNSDFGAESVDLKVDAICSLRLNEWQGRKTWQWICEDYIWEKVESGVESKKKFDVEENNDFEW